MSGPGRVPVVVIGVGNGFRRDDGAGPAVIGALRDQVPSGVGLVITDGEPTRLIEAWTGAALAVVVDAVRAQPPHPGRIHRFVVDRPGVGAGRPASSHGLGLDDAIALALALDRMPGRLIVHAIEAADLTQGTGLTPAVAEAVGVVAAAILDDIGAGRRLSASWPRSEPKDLRSLDLSPLPAPVPEDQRRLRHPTWPAPVGHRRRPTVLDPDTTQFDKRAANARARLAGATVERRWSRIRGTLASGRLASGRAALGVTGSKDVISMRVLVVYESICGNTHVVASNIADGLRATHEVILVPVADATADLVAEADLLIVGAPTHMHGLSTASSRQAARKATAKPESGLTLDPPMGRGARGSGRTGVPAA